VYDFTKYVFSEIEKAVFGSFSGFFGLKAEFCESFKQCPRKANKLNCFVLYLGRKGRNYRFIFLWPMNSSFAKK